MGHLKDIYLHWRQSCRHKSEALHLIFSLLRIVGASDVHEATLLFVRPPKACDHLRPTSFSNIWQEAILRSLSMEDSFLFRSRLF